MGYEAKVMTDKPSDPFEPSDTEIFAAAIRKTENISSVVVIHEVVPLKDDEIWVKAWIRLSIDDFSR